jgi:hypothetical protein
MESAGINYWAVLVSAIAYMVLGAVWYSPVLFGNAWMKGIGKSKEQVAADFSPSNYIFAFAGSFIASYGIARIMAWSGGDSVVDGIKVSLVAGVCFVFATMSVNDTFEKRSGGLSMINILYHVIGLVIAGIIVGLWR